MTDINTLSYRVQQLENHAERISAKILDPNTVNEKLEHLRREIDRLDEELSELEKNQLNARAGAADREKRVSSIEGTIKWIARMIVGAVIAALLALVLNKNGGI